MYPDYCGPTALAAITGMDRVDAAAALAPLEKKRGVRRVLDSTHWGSMLEAISALEGFNAKERRIRPQNPHTFGKAVYPTVAQWQRREHTCKGLWLLLAAHHFIVVEDGEVIWDNGYDPRRGRVLHAAQIELSGARKRERSRTMTKRIYKGAQALIDEHGLDSEKISGTGSNGAVTKSDVEAYLVELENDSKPSAQAIIRAGLEQDLSNAEIIQTVKEAYPDSNIKPGWVAWTIGNERRRETDWWKQYGPQIVEERGVKL